jgi:hypothetical protein
MATINGTSASDPNLEGTALADIIDAKGGHDVVHAGDGDDSIRGGAGNDTLHGGDGDDSFVGGTGDRFDQFFGGAGTDTIAWSGIVGLTGDFGAGNGIESIDAAGIDGDGSSQTLDFSTTAFAGVAVVDAAGGHDRIVTSLSREPAVADGLVLKGGAGNDKVTVTIAPGDFVGSSGGVSLAGLVKDISQSLTANFDTGFTFDDSLGLRVEDFELG